MLTTDSFFDDENKDELKRLELDSGSLFAKLSNLGSGNAVLEKVQTGKNFDEISQRRWNDLRFASASDDSQDPDPCESLPYTADFYTDGISFLKLMQFIKTRYTEKFDYKQFEGTKVEGSYTMTSPTTMVTTTSTYSYIYNVPFEYTDSNGIRRITELSGRLNKRVCYLEKSPPNLQSGWRFDLDPKNEVINATLSFYYKGTYTLRHDLPDTPDQNDYTLGDQYRAIIISTKNVNDFIALMKDIYSDYTARETAKDIVQKYVNTLKSCNDSKQLKFLYNNIPDFVIDDIKTNGTLTTEVLWGHLMLLTEYDDTGLFSCFRDASSALINVLKCVGDSKILYKKFVDDPILVRRIYYNLNGSSEIEQLALDGGGNIVTTKVTEKNAVIFSTFIAGLCNINNYEGLAQPTKTFYHGGIYKLDANALGNDEGDKFFIQQQKEVPLEGMDFTPFTDIINDDDGGFYGPMELVLWKDADNNNEESNTIIVPAIFVKALSDEAEWQEINKNIRLGLDVLMIVLGAITVVTTGNPFVFALAVADIGIATTDIAVQTFRKEIEGIEGGKEFLKAWETVYLVGTLVTATPAVIGSLFKLGNTIIKAAAFVKNGGVRNFVMSIFFKVIIERNIANFTKGTLKNITTGYEAVRNAGVVFKFAGIDRLEKAGVAIFRLLSSEGEEVYIAYYKDQVIAKGAAKEFRDALKKVWDARGVDLLEKLEAILNRRRIVSVRDAGLLGQAPKTGTKMVFELIDELGNSMGKLTRLPNGKELIYKFIYEGKEWDINCLMRFLDKPIKELPVYEGEHLLFADFNIPKSITDKISGLGQIMLDDGLIYFNRSRNYGKIDGMLNVWTKSESYAEYGGQSINLEQFWNAVDKGKMTYEQAAFETFSGKWAKKNGFGKVRFRNIETDVTRDNIILNFIKNKK